MKKTHTRRRRRLPPLNPLRAFEAAARHGSFTRAATELAVTQGAVSRAVSALETHLGVTDGEEAVREHVDARIRYGKGRWRDVENIFLYADELCPVCAPNVLDPAKRPYDLETLQTLVMIHHRRTRDSWIDWLTMVGVPGLRPRGDITFEELGVAYEAAAAGLGIVLGQRRHLTREMASGALFEPFPQVLRRDIGYYLTFAPSRIEKPGFRAFSDWIVEACRD